MSLQNRFILDPGPHFFISTQLQHQNSKKERSMTRSKLTSIKALGGKMKSKRFPMGGVKKPFRYRPGTVALREIRKYQSSTETLIPKLVFQRLVKEIMQNECLKRGIDCRRIQSTALLALQEAGEQFITDLLCNAQLAAIHGKRVTVKPEDMYIVLHFRNESKHN